MVANEEEFVNKICTCNKQWIDDNKHNLNCPVFQYYAFNKKLTTHRENIMNILCRIGIHKWWPEDNNYFTPIVIYFRTYMRCQRCKKWGKLVFSKKVENKP